MTIECNVLKQETFFNPDLQMPSLTWLGKVMVLLVSVPTMASLYLPSAQDTCMLTVTVWKTMQSTSSILSTGMTSYILYDKNIHELHFENISMNVSFLFRKHQSSDVIKCTTLSKITQRLFFALQ